MTQKDSDKILDVLTKGTESIELLANTHQEQLKSVLLKHFQANARTVEIISTVLDDEDKHYLHQIDLLKRALESARKSKNEEQVKKVRSLLSGMETAYSRVKQMNQRIKRLIDTL